MKTQIRLPAVERMPALPRDYQLRDWRKTARQFDRLAFDENAAGQFLPLIWRDTDSRPPTFGLPSYVGHPGQSGGGAHEAIACLAALLSGTLTGADKRRWLPGATAYFNDDNGESVVLNHTRTESGNSFWYDLLPQALFFALTDRNRPFGRSDEVFVRNSRALLAMVGVLSDGGRRLPDFDITGFSFRDGKPRRNGKWIEPDAAGATAWLLIAAHRRLRDARYLDAAEACLRWLEARRENPVYEMLMPLGVVAAARRNAEGGRRFDVAKLLNWCLTPSAARPGWGVITGTWGGRGVDGLAGSVTDGGGYAFLMNSLWLPAILAPVARYEPRLARAIARFIRNASSAARLFYPDALPAMNQSCAWWRGDPDHCLGYEGLRREWEGVSPKAMGDPLRFGWAKTDFAVYGSAFAGILASVVAPTDAPGIQRIDLRATDFFARPSPPTFLYDNPHPAPRTVTVEVGSAPCDVYDAIEERTIRRNVRGAFALTLGKEGADDAIRVLSFIGHP